MARSYWRHRSHMIRSDTCINVDWAQEHKKTVVLALGDMVLNPDNVSDF